MMKKLRKKESILTIAAITILVVAELYIKFVADPAQKVINAQSAAKLINSCEVSDVTFEVHTGYTEMILKNGKVRSALTSTSNDAIIRNALINTDGLCKPDPTTGIE